MNIEVNNFLNNLSKEQLETLKQLLNEDNLDDKRTTKTKKDQETISKTKEKKYEAQQKAESHQEEKANKETTAKTKEVAIVNKNFTVTRSTTQTNRKVPVKYRRNEWKDVGEHQDIETPNFEKTPRNRSKPNKQEVECHVCGKVFSINSNLVYGEYHRCNKCTGR